MAWDPVWEDVFKEQPWGKYPGEDLIRFIARNFYQAPNRNNIKVLEVGCGTGANLWYMAREGFSVYGIDGSDTAISQARERLDAECRGWTGDLLVGDIGQLPFADDFFDAVIDNEVVYCNSYEQSQAIYREMSRVTRPGGKLFSRTFAVGSWGEGTGLHVGHNAWIVAEGPLLNKGYSRFTDLVELEDLLRGFLITEVEELKRTMGGRQHKINEWIVLAVKSY
jgi:SAM-dependent methyltransferase